VGCRIGGYHVISELLPHQIPKPEKERNEISKKKKKKKKKDPKKVQPLSRKTYILGDQSL